MTKNAERLFQPPTLCPRKMFQTISRSRIARVATCQRSLSLKTPVVDDFSGYDGKRPWSSRQPCRTTPPRFANQRQNEFRYFQRHFSSNGSGSVVFGADPVLDISTFQDAIMGLAPAIARGLATEGYYTSVGILPMDMITLIRNQAVELRRQGRFEQSWSERIVGDGSVQRFDKEGVFACEPDGQDYDVAPDMIVYMSVLLQTLPMALNQAFDVESSSKKLLNPSLSNSSFNAKLAVTLPGGSTYPLHIDNPQGLEVHDTRKLTCILYLNPNYQADRGDGGELRLLLGADRESIRKVDLTPEGGRMVLFWSDEIPHEVLPTAPEFVNGTMDLTMDNPLDRYALTLWIPTQDVSTIHNEASQFRSLRDLAFP